MERRTAKAQATRERIRQTAVELHNERLWDDFTLEEVARRASTTVQTVLRIYGSKEALSLLAAEASARRHRQASPPGSIEAAVRVLYDDYEAIGDRVIHYLALEPRLPRLRPLVELGRQAHRKWVRSVFAPQLDARSGRARSRLLYALVVATDVYVWKLLRRDLDLDRGAAENVIKAMISAVAEGKANGEIPLGVLGRGRKPSAEPRDRPRARSARP